MLAVLRFIIKFGIDKAIKKFGKSAVSKATKKTVPKSKPVKKVTELQRVKEQIARDMKKKKTPNPKGKPTGSVVRNYRGKPEPTYSTGKKYKPYVPPKKP